MRLGQQTSLKKKMKVGSQGAICGEESPSARGRSYTKASAGPQAINPSKAMRIYKRKVRSVNERPDTAGPKIEMGFEGSK